MTHDSVAFLKSLLMIPSHSGQEGDLAEFLLGRMAGLGFEVHRDPAGNIVGSVGNPDAERTLVLLGHMDTVPGVVPVRLENNCLYGRGAVDAKGPLAAFILAAAQVKGEMLDKRLVVIGAVEEEANSKGAHYLAQHMDPPDGVIIGEPSGWHGITLGYKGTLRIHLECSKPAGHSAGRDPAPAEVGIAFWNRLVDYTDRVNCDRNPPRFDTLDPALRSIHTRGDGLQERVAIEIGLRMPLAVEESALRETIRDWVEGCEVSFPYSEPAFRAEKNTPVVRAMLRAIRQEGGRPRFKVKTGTSDMNVVGPVWGCPIVAYGPGNSSLDHTPTEHVEVDEFRRGIRVLANALRLW